MDNKEKIAAEFAMFMVRKEMEFLPKENQEKINECSKKLTDLINEYGDNGIIALALVGTEFQLKALGVV